MAAVARIASRILGITIVALAGCTATAQTPDAASVARGQRLYLRCVACHDIAGTAIDKNGPTLKGVVGRKVASVAGYAYSKSLAAQSFEWDAAHLDAWLARPAAVAPGTTMAFEGMPEEKDRKALIDYLKAQK